MQTYRFWVYSLSHSVYLILTHQVNISPALNHPQAIFEETRDHLYCQSLPELLKPASPKLFALPCPALPTKSTIKAVAQVFPSFLLLPPGASPVALHGTPPSLEKCKQKILPMALISLCHQFPYKWRSCEYKWDNTNSFISLKNHFHSSFFIQKMSPLQLFTNMKYFQSIVIFKADLLG